MFKLHLDGPPTDHRRVRQTSRSVLAHDMAGDTTLIVLLVGSTFVTTILNLWFQRSNSRALEVERARIGRSAHLREQQSALIADLFAKLWLANYCVQRASARERIAAELRQRYREEASKLFGEAAKCFYPRQILFPEEMALRIDALLRDLEDAQLNLAIVLDDATLGESERETRWEDVTGLVRRRLPRVFDDLKALSRNLLHGD